MFPRVPPKPASEALRPVDNSPKTSTGWPIPSTAIAENVHRMAENVHRKVRKPLLRRRFYAPNILNRF